MRQDQYERLQTLQEKLMDVFLSEADPAGWPGDGIEPRTMDKATRGDRVWCKKDAAGTAVLIMKAMSMTGMIQRGAAEGGTLPPEGAPEDEQELDDAIQAAEREAAKVLANVQARMKKTE